MKIGRFSRLRIFFLCFFGLFVAVPLLYTLINSLAAGPAYGLLPLEWALDGWYKVLVRRPPYLVKFWNSLLLIVAVAAGLPVLFSLAGVGVL